MANLAVHPVDEKLPTPRLAALGLQHVLVMYAGAVAVPLIVGRALKLSPDQVALLISADLFCCGLVTLIQSLGFGRYFGIKLPVMMGVTFAAVGPMMAMTNVDFKTGRHNLYIVAIAIGAGMIPLVAPRWTQQMAHSLHPLLESGILLTAVAAVLLNFYFNGGRADEAAAINAAKTAEAH